MEFLSDESDFSRKSRETEDENSAGGNMVLWIVAIMVLLGLNAFSWIFCMYVFGHPEEPFNYNLLVKLEKVPRVRGFQPTTVPRGKFHDVKELYRSVYDYNDGELKAYNDIKKRHYLKNYYERDDVTFLGGEFVVQNVRKLGEKDIFPRGFAIRARSESFPDGMVDFIIPAGSEEDVVVSQAKKNDDEDSATQEKLPLVPLPEKLYVAGETLVIEESTTCAALLNVDRQDEDLMVFTVVPLVNRAFKAANGNELNSRPPQRLNMAARRWPMSDNGLVSNPIRPADEEGESEGDDAKSAEESKEVAASN